MRDHLDELGERARQVPPGPAPTREWIESRRSQRRRNRWLAAGSGLVVLGLAAGAVLTSGGDDAARTEAVESAPQPTVPGSTTSSSPIPGSSSSTTGSEPTGEALEEAEAPLEDRIEGLEAALRAWAIDSGTPGFAMAVVSGDGIVHRAEVGFADRDDEIPVTADTLFHVGAMQSSMNALLIATLVEDGVFDWDTPAAELVPEAGLDPDITIRHLLNMTAGIALDAGRQLPTGEIPPDAVGPTVFSAAAREENRPAEPGAKFFLNEVSAATAGYAAAGTLATDDENVYQAYLRLFTQRILEPLGMNDSTLLSSEARASGQLSQSYSIVGREVPTTDIDVDVLTPAGALTSTATDLGLYLQMLLSNGVTTSGETMVSTESIATMTTPVLDDYAMGWFHGVNPNGVTFFGHGGFFDGFVGYIVAAPEADLGLVVLTNSASDDRGFFETLGVFVDSIEDPSSG